MSYFQYRDVKLYYESKGTGIPMLFIHGWGIDHTFLSNALEPVFSDITHHGDMISVCRYYVDVPGMGQSEPGFVKRTDDVVEVLEAFIDAFFQKEPFLIAGNSFGGKLCRAIVHDRPDQVLGMLLICPANGDETVLPGVFRVCRVDEELMNSLTKREADEFSVFDVIQTRDAWERYQRDVYHAVLANDTNEFLLHVLCGNLTYDLNEKMKKVPYSGPVCIITGREDHAVGYEEQFQWLKYYPQATYLALEGAGHNLTIDRPEILVPLVREWLYFHLTE